VHAAGAACIVIAVPALAGAVLGGLLLALGAVAARDRALLRGARALRAIEVGEPGVAVLVLADGSRVAAMLTGRRRVNRYWLSLPVRAPARRTLFVTAGMLGPSRFRALRLWALWGRVPGVASGQLQP